MAGHEISAHVLVFHRQLSVRRLTSHSAVGSSHLLLLLIINVKKTTVYTHVNGDRPSHIENSKNKKVISPVSYTHLTLPTKRIV